MSGKRVGKPERKRTTTSKVIAIGVLIMDAVATLAVLALCGLAIVRQFQGALPYLTTLIGALQAVTETRLNELTREVREHNNFARRMPVVEEQIKVINHRIDDLEEAQK